MRGKAKVTGGLVSRGTQSSAARNGKARRLDDAGERGPDLTFELAWHGRGIAPVAGIDEAGRGPFAGPVVAAAVILDHARIPAGINDSKTIKADDRARLFVEIMAHAEVGVGIADVARIDRDNILQATLWAMAQAVSRLPRAPAVSLVDGNQSPRLSCVIETIVDGDARALSIAAASIIAKVTRDRIMTKLAAAHPGYGWERNMGYGVPEHRSGIARLGLTPHHRLSFKPVHEAASILGLRADDLALAAADVGDGADRADIPGFANECPLRYRCFSSIFTENREDTFRKSCFRTASPHPRGLQLYAESGRRHRC